MSGVHVCSLHNRGRHTAFRGLTCDWASSSSRQIWSFWSSCIDFCGSWRGAMWSQRWLIPSLRITAVFVSASHVHNHSTSLFFLQFDVEIVQTEKVFKIINRRPKRETPLFWGFDRVDMLMYCPSLLYDGQKVCQLFDRLSDRWGLMIFAQGQINCVALPK